MTTPEMTSSERLTRQALEVINNTIQDLCKRRDMLAAQLPNAPKQTVPKFAPCGMEIKLGGRSTRKKRS